MTKNELSNTFLNGTVITAKYDDGHYIVDFQDTDDEVSRNFVLNSIISS